MLDTHINTHTYIYIHTHTHTQTINHFYNNTVLVHYDITKFLSTIVNTVHIGLLFSRWKFTNAANGHHKLLKFNNFLNQQT